MLLMAKRHSFKTNKRTFFARVIIFEKKMVVYARRPVGQL